MTEMTPALVVSQYGGPEVTHLGEVALAPLQPGQVRVDIAMSGINFIDIYHREGIYLSETPFVLGVEGAGTIAAMAEDVSGFSIGQRVAWAPVLGSHAGAMNINADSLVEVPEAVSDQLAAAVLMQGMTAHYLVNSTYRVKPGDTVVVHAAAGGVGQLLVQMAKSAGAQVIGAVSSAAKVEKASAAGADLVIRTDTIEDAEHFAKHVREATNGVGAQVVYDGVGFETFDASLMSLAPRGTLALFGAASGQVAPFDLQRLNSGGSLFVTRPTLAHYVATRAELLWRAGEVFDAVANGRLHVEVGGIYDLADAHRAYDLLEGRRSTGKLLLRR